MPKTCSIKLQQLFIDFLKFRKRVLERVWAATSCRTPPELIYLLEAIENNEFLELKEVARSITLDASFDFLFSGAWWREQGIEFDFSCKIVS